MIHFNQKRKYYSTNNQTHQKPQTLIELDKRGQFKSLCATWRDKIIAKINLIAKAVRKRHGDSNLCDCFGTCMKYYCRHNAKITATRLSGRTSDHSIKDRTKVKTE